MLKSESIIQLARDKAGLERFHSDSYREGLDRLVDSFNRAPLVSDAGRQVFTEIHSNSLKARLELDDYIERHPEVLDTPVVRPVVVLGMPRTGTTLASYLLGADPARRSLLRWQIAMPVPPTTVDKLRTDPRCLAMIETDAAQEFSSMKSMHYEPPDGPSECIFVHQQDGRSLSAEAEACMPDYSQWLLSTDMTSAYRHHKRFLQVLQSTAPGTWNLKMPSHALYLKALLATYPDARIVWTHRDPYTAMGSLCSLISASQAIFNTRGDDDYIGRHYPAQMAEHLNRPHAVRKERGADFMYDLHYAALMRDPIGEMRRLYAWLGDEFTPEAEAGMRAWLDANPQHKHGKHTYNLERFGLSVEKLHPWFADYVRNYDVELDR